MICKPNKLESLVKKFFFYFFIDQLIFKSFIILRFNLYIN